jgi:Cu/Zn superoxide dismutase
MVACIRRVAVLATAMSLLLAGCATERDSSNPGAAHQIGNLVAPLVGVGSAATGKIIVVDNGNGKGVTLTMNVANLIQGNYRLAFHENPHCASRSVAVIGPVWGPPDSATPPGELIPIAYAGMTGEIYLTVRIPGVHVEGTPTLRGRSIVLHWGNTVDTPFPGMPNNYIACGVFENIQGDFFDPLDK